MRAAYRIAMVGSSAADVDSMSAGLTQVMGGMAQGSSDDGTTTEEDFDFLWGYGSKSTVGEMVEVIRMSASAGSPGADVGGVPGALPMDNGNTLVTCTIKAQEEMVLQWEVSKAKNLITPKTKWAEALMKTVEQQ